MPCPLERSRGGPRALPWLLGAVGPGAWLLGLVRSDAELAGLVPQLARRDVGELLRLLPPSSPVVDWIEGMRCRNAGAHRGGRVHYHDLDLQDGEITGRKAPREE